MAVIRDTRSVCPKCLRPLPAALCREPSGKIYLEKSCPDHGPFRALVWQGEVDFDTWTRSAQPLEDPDCSPKSCGGCTRHDGGTCCCLLEVTARCNLSCSFCFANGGREEDDPTLEELKTAISHIARDCGGPLLQLSGGEPTLREDLPELIAHAKEAGCAYVQVNTNGIRLARDPEYARKLRDAGLDIVFLQFDGTEDAIYQALRGRPLLKIKEQAIRVCGALGLGVTLVPTVVPGVNDHNLGDLIRYAARRIPAVRGIHFQPVSYFGRHPSAPGAEDRYPLDRLMGDISRQTGIPLDSFMPSRCDHPLCGFHASFLAEPSGMLRPLTRFARSSHQRGTCRDNREYVARHWRRYPQEPEPESGEEMDFDTFLYRIRHGSLTLSAMAFQDAGNLNLERLHRCTLHVYTGGKVKPFCANYLTGL